MSNCRTCLKCGWVYFGVTLAFAKAEVEKFNQYYDALEVQKQQDYYGGTKAKLENYLYCGCGNYYKNFRHSKPKDCPDGCTLNPIVYNEEELNNESTEL